MRIFNNNKNILMAKNAGVVVLFFIVSLILLNGLFANNYPILGCDWGLPYTDIQIDTGVSTSTSTWYGVNFGVRHFGISSLYFYSTMKILSAIGINGALFVKLFLIFIYTFSGLSMFKLLEYLHCKYSSSIFGGMIYITTPLFFNYTIMGWQYVLLTMALFPLVIKYFIKSVKEDKLKSKIILGVLLFLSIQSQSIVWYFISFGYLFFYLVKDKSSFFTYYKTIASIVVLFFVVNAYWLIGLLLFSDKAITGSNIVNSAGSLGTLGHFTPAEIIRLFGSLFNYQYEFILVESKMELLYLIFPLTAFGALFLKKNKKLIISFSLLAVFPFFLYILNFYRDILLLIPFANVFRDFARFMTLPTLAYPVLIGLVLDNLLRKENKKNKRILGYSILVFIFFSIYPWWSFKITDWKEGLGIHQRLRTKVFPDEYLYVENMLSQNKIDLMALFLPINGNVNYEDDPKYHGYAQETADIFACYFRTTGVIVSNDRNNGHSDSYVREIRNILNGNSVNLESMIQNTNIGFIVIRKNMVMRNKENIIRSLESGSMFKKYYDSDKIVVYKKKEAGYLPHFYVPEVEIYTAQDLSKLPLIIAANSGKIKSSVYFVDKENKKKNAVFDSAELKVKENAEQPVIEYKKINFTKYRVVVHNAKAPFKLIFSESFHEDWKVYSGCYKRQNIELENSKYKILNGSEDSQASIGELRKHVERGDISALGDFKEKNAGGEKYYIDFVSKNYNGTIQNDNLANGMIYETWFKNSIIDNTHKMVNGYANSWSIDPEQLFKSNVKCVKKNTDGSYDLELIVEYWHQRMFYLGLFMTLTFFAVALAYLVFNYYKQHTGRSAGEKA